MENHPLIILQEWTWKARFITFSFMHKFMEYHNYFFQIIFFPTYPKSWKLNKATFLILCMQLLKANPMYTASDNI
jgi:hypothetical protein